MNFSVQTLTRAVIIAQLYSGNENQLTKNIYSNEISLRPFKMEPDYKWEKGVLYTADRISLDADLATDIDAFRF